MSWEAGGCKFEYNGGGLPDNLKLIKQISIFPLELTATGSLNPRTRQWSYALGCRDTILDGRLTFNASRQAVEYRKALPFAFGGGLAKPVVAAEWRLGQSWRAPRLQLGLAVTDDDACGSDDGASIGRDGALRFRRKVFVTRRWGLEVDGTARLRLSHDLAGGVQLGDMGVHVAARELNLVYRI